VQIPELSSIVVVVDPVTVTDAEVGEHLDQLRHRFATLTPVPRPAERGDVVRIDLAASIDGTAVERGSAGDVTHEVGAGHPLAGLDEAITGLRAGESTTIRTQLVGGPSAGQDADLTVTVTTVMRRRPAGLDEVAAGFGTVEELTADLRGRLSTARRGNQLYAARDAALRAIAAAAAVQAPHDAVRTEAARRRRALTVELEGAGVALDEHLAALRTTEQALDLELAEAAAERVRGLLVLDALADAEQLPVSQDELSRWVLQRAGQARREPADYLQRLADDGMAGAVFGDIRRGKALALVMDRVVVKDTTGTVVTFGDLRDAYGHDGHDHDVPRPGTL
jgi:trigger factor